MSLPSIVNKNSSMNDSTFLKNEKNQNQSSPHQVEFWVNNPNVLFQKEYIFEFYPTETMSYNQKLNTITRVIIILAILLFLVTRNFWVIIVSAITIFSIYLYYKKDFNEKHILEEETEGYENPAQVFLKENGKPVPPNVDLFQTPDSKNPFSNILIPDYEYNPEKKNAPPCYNGTVNTVILEQAKNLVKEQNKGQPNIANKLFENLNEELNFEQSLRPFHSTANTTIPNDQTGFLDFCYGNAISCKEGNLFACARNTSHYTLY
jgi:hypothetical protein